MKIPALALLILFTALLPRAEAAEDYLQTIALPGNECFSDVAALKSGDLVATGVDFASNDALMLRLNNAGNVLRSQKISGSGADEAQAVVSTSDGGFVIGGSTSSFGAGNTDAFLMKMRANGSIAWKRTFGTSGNEHIIEVVETADRGLIILSDADHDPNLNDIVIAKFSSGGQFQWRKVITAGAFDHASGMGKTSDNGVVVAIAAEMPDGIRSVVVKLNATGAVQWSRIYGSSGTHLALSAIEAPEGGYYFTETFSASGTPTSRTVLSRLDAAGIPVWSRSYQSAGRNLMATVSVTPQGLLLAGNTTTPDGNNSRGILIGLDANGRVLWRKRVQPDTRPTFLSKPYVLSGSSSIVVSGCAGLRDANNMDALVLKVASNGTIAGGCSKLSTFPLSSAAYNLTSTAITLEEIPVPFLTGNAGFQTISSSATESPACTSE